VIRLAFRSLRVLFVRYADARNFDVHHMPKLEFESPPFALEGSSAHAVKQACRVFRRFIATPCHMLIGARVPLAVRGVGFQVGEDSDDAGTR
jgi:hypothetical protein